MEIQVDVNVVAPAEFHGLIDFFQHRFAQAAPVLGVGPAAIRKRQACEVEAPLGYKGEVCLAEGAMPIREEFFQQVEPSPARKLGGAWFCLCVRPSGARQNR